MKLFRVFAAAAAVSIVVGLSACASTPEDTPIINPVAAPVTVSVNELEGKTVEVALNQVININTDSLAVDSYTAEIADPSIVEFVQGKEDGSAVFNPGLTPLKVGTTEVTLINDQGGIQPLTFTVTVTK
jgi:hypothetical protein